MIYVQWQIVGPKKNQSINERERERVNYEII